MISHKHKCIFIHIPRCGGTSMEVSMVGDNWFIIDPTTKHLIASTAKKVYEPYWDDYFKFSFVRNPWDRMVSMTKFSSFFGVHIKNGNIDISDYLKNFPQIEIDPRSKSQGETFNPIKNSVFLNILDLELDFVGRFETLQQDFDIVCDKIGIPQQQLPHVLSREDHSDNRSPQSSKTDHKHYTEYYDDETREIVAEKYARDIEYFGYKFGE